MQPSFEQVAGAVRNTFLQHYPQVKKAYIFGSFADGSQTERSDVDVMIEMDTPMGFDFFGMIDDVEKAVAAHVDLITVCQAQELENKYEYDIFGKAKMIYERKPK